MEQAQLNERRQWLFIALAGLFVTNAVTAELISNKLIQIPLKGFLFGQSIWPIHHHYWYFTMARCLFF